MCCEHRREARPFHQGAVLRPAHRAVIRIGAQQALRQLLQDRGVDRDIGAADIVRDTPRAIGESGVAQIPDQSPDRSIVQCARLDTAADRQRNQQDGIAERILIGARGDARCQLQEFLGNWPCPIEWSVRHRGILRRIVQCSKRWMHCGPSERAIASEPAFLPERIADATLPIGRDELCSDHRGRGAGLG